ncbi:sensor histidine kinase [Nakamurella sp.]|uniref:sensor histidine kinase n=1 Tax=Nakamurella sp. TaxID=1869182 RepID=UPI0037844D78
MPASSLTPVFVGLRTGLHIVVVGLTVFVVAQAWSGDSRGPVIAVATGFLAVYGAGFAAGADRNRSRFWSRIWIATLSVLWIGLLWFTPAAAYLAFPLFFLYLAVMPGWRGPFTVALATVFAVVGGGMHGGWSVGGVVGPLVGAAMALLIGAGYRSLLRESAERERLMAELVATRQELADREREAGAAQERERLAREIHDTLAQGLSSIQMLLQAAERADPSGPGAAQVRLARETTADNLAEARALVRELSPPPLAGTGLVPALRRLAQTQWSRTDLTIDVVGDDTVDLPMATQTALLRIAQGTMANVLQHSGATRATVSVSRSGGCVRLSVVDNGAGFDPDEVLTGSGRPDSFGLAAAQARVEQLGGSLRLDSAPGRGTAVTVEIAGVPA